MTSPRSRKTSVVALFHMESFCVCVLLEVCVESRNRSTLLGMYELRYMRQRSVHKMKIEMVDPGRREVQE